MAVNSIKKGRLFKEKLLSLANKIEFWLNASLTILIDPPISDPTPKTAPVDDTMQPSPPELPPTILKNKLISHLFL